MLNHELLEFVEQVSMLREPCLTLLELLRFADYILQVLPSRLAISQLVLWDFELVLLLLKLYYLVL